MKEDELDPKTESETSKNTSEPNTVLALNSNQEEKEKSYDTEDDEKDNS